MSKIREFFWGRLKKPKNIQIKCYNCDKWIDYINLKYVLRIPEQMSYAAVCKSCYNKRQGNALPVEEIRKSKINHNKLEFDKLLDLP